MHTTQLFDINVVSTKKTRSSPAVMAITESSIVILLRQKTGDAAEAFSRHCTAVGYSLQSTMAGSKDNPARMLEGGPPPQKNRYMALRDRLPRLVENVPGALAGSSLTFQSKTPAEMRTETRYLCVFCSTSLPIRCSVRRWRAHLQRS